MSRSVPDWDAIFREYLPRVYNYFLYRVNNRQIAEDLTSETFERVWVNRDKYRADTAKFSTWLFAIAHHIAVDFYRKRKLKLISIEEVYYISGDDSPEKIIQEKFELEKLARLIAELPEREQDIISLKYGADFSHQEIAELLDISESNVGTIIHRTVNQIRRLLLEKEIEKHG